MWLNRIREKINLSLYDSKDFVLSLFRVSHIIIALSMVAVLVYYYGFPQTENSKEFLTQLIEYSFLFYILKYFVKILYEYNAFFYIKEHWVESLLVLILIVEGIARNFFGTFATSHVFEWFGVHHFDEFSNTVIQLFFVIYIFVEMYQKGRFRQSFKIHPGLLFTISIAFLILVGTGLLMLPEMTVPSEKMSFVDSLFLSTSAVSCTGMDTVGIDSFLSIKGQVVIMFLIQLGALNTIAFAALYLLVSKFGIGIKQHDLVDDYVNDYSILATESMFVRIVRWVLMIELAGFSCIYFLFGVEGLFQSTPTQIFQSMFYAISNFSNAGFTIVQDGMFNPYIVDNYTLQLVSIGLYFIGGFGMIYLFDIFGSASLRKRMENPWRSMRFDTKVNLYVSLMLVVVGFFVFYILERNNVLEGMAWWDKFVTTLFNSTTARQTGNTTVNPVSLTLPVLLFYMIFMLIGAGSGSSGGGIRVSSFAVIYSSIITFIQNKPHVVLFKRRIGNDLVMKAYIILVFFIVGNIVGVFALFITEQASLEAGVFRPIDLIFEHVAASTTVGMTLDVTAKLSAAGKVVTTIAMFIGRVNSLTILYLFGKQLNRQKFKYPKEHMTVG